MSEREFALDVVKRLRDAGFTALWAGGCVRDELLGITPQDHDVATDAHPEQVRRLFKRTVAVGLSFGVVEVLGPRTPTGPLKIQVATFRSDGAYTDGRHPDDVVFSTPEEDARRRDFTINGMFWDPLEEKLIDFVDGQRDLQAKVLRAIGDPKERIAEDKLRMLRAVRMAVRFSLTIDPATEKAIQASAAEIGVVSAERIADELHKMLIHPRRAQGIQLMVDLGLADAILPDVVFLKTFEQTESQSGNTRRLWTHLLRVLDLLGEEPSFPLVFAALMQDVGKPHIVERRHAGEEFPYHEAIGRKTATQVALRLKLSNQERERIEWLVEKHQYLCDVRSFRPSGLKTILIHPGIRELLTLHRANAVAEGHSVDHVDFCEQLLRDWSPEVLNPPPLITGYDLSNKGFQPGPIFKRLLDAVREAQLDGTITTKAEALALVDRLAATSHGV